MHSPRLRLFFAASLLLAVNAHAQPATSTGATQLVNVASSGLGAKGVGVGQDLVDGSQAALASKTGNQPAFTVINLAGEVEMNKVSLDVGKQKGKLRIVALKDDGAPDLSSGKVVTEFSLDGNTTTVSADVNDVKAKRVAIVWVPDTPGQQLTMSNVGIFTSKPEAITSLPEVKAIMQTAAATPAPVAATSAAATAAAAPAPTPAPAAATPAPAAPATTATASAPAATGNSGSAASGSGSSSSAAGAARPATVAAAPVSNFAPPATVPPPVLPQSRGGSSNGKPEDDSKENSK